MKTFERCRIDAAELGARNPFTSPISGDIFYRSPDGFFCVDLKTPFLTAITRQNGERGSQSYTQGFADALRRDGSLFVAHRSFTKGSGANQHGFTIDERKVVKGEESIEWMRWALIEVVIDHGWKDTVDDFPEFVEFAWLADVLTP